MLTVTVIKYSTYLNPYKPEGYNEKKLTSFEEISWRVSKTSFEFSPYGIKTKKTELGTTTIGLDKKDLTRESFETRLLNKGSAEVKILTDKFSEKEFYIESTGLLEFKLNTFNFPGWQANLDGKEIKINDNNKYKLISVLVPEGNHKLTFIFKNTPIRTLGNLISIFSLIVLVCLLLSLKKDHLVSSNR